MNVTNLTTLPFGHPFKGIPLCTRFLTAFGMTKGNVIAFFLLLLFLLPSVLMAQTIRYVKLGGTGDGSSWENASGNIQAMINASSASNHVWVAGGVYPVTETLILKDGVNIYGGFEGTESNITQRKKGVDAWDFTHTTVLDGQNAVLVISGGAEANLSFRIPTTIDGFTITNGNHTATFPSGGGLQLTGFARGVFTVSNCIVSNNKTVATGTSSNESRGAGIYATGATIINCKVVNNIATRSETAGAVLRGAGIYLTSGGNIINCLISGNIATSGNSLSAQSRGGGIYAVATNMTENVRCNIINCLVVGNQAITEASGSYSSAGGAYLQNAEVINCTFVKNKAEDIAGGVQTHTRSGVLVINSVFWQNDGGRSTLQINTGILRDCAIEGGFETPGTENIMELSANNNAPNGPLFVNPDAGNYRLQFCSPLINAGRNDVAGVGTDLDGNTRVYDGTIDMGAYEFQISKKPIITQNGFILTANLEKGNYKWYLNDLLIPGATAQSYTWKENGYYSVEVSYESCKAMSDKMLVEFVPVTHITDLTLLVAPNKPALLTGTVVPANATAKTITWSVKNAGATGATIEGNIFTATAKGTAEVVATIVNGTGMTAGADYKQEFTILVTDFVPVANIINLPDTAVTNITLPLSGTIIPNNATNQHITWSIKNAGTTEATITGNSFYATKRGTAVVTAKIENGLTVSEDFIQDFKIVVVPNKVPRTPLIESFSSSTCGPCRQGNIDLKKTLEEYVGEYALIKYQTRFPGTGDPYYTAEVGTKQDYYSVSGVPTVRLDGLRSMHPSLVKTETLEELEGAPSHIELSVEYYLEGKTMYAKAEIVNRGDIYTGGNLRLFIAIVEKRTEKNKKTNGETEFFQITKKFMPEPTGIVLDQFLTPHKPYTFSQSWEFKGGYRLPENASDPINHSIEHSVEDFDNLTIVAWVQDFSTKGVFQACNGINIKERVVTFSAIGGGEISATIDGDPINSGTRLNIGDVVSFTATPHPDYEVAEWMLNGEVVSPENPNELTVHYDGEYLGMDVTVEFQKPGFFNVKYSTVNSFGTLTATANGESIASGTSVPKDSRIVFTATPIKDYEIKEWKNNGTIVGHTSTEYIIETIDQNIDVTVEFKPVVGINNPALADIKVYPNPTSGELRVMSYELRVMNVEVFDIYGRNVGTKLPSNSLEGWTRSGRGGKEERQPESDGVVLDISHLHSGIYFLKITTDQGTIMKKIVKN